MLRASNTRQGLQGITPWQWQSQELTGTAEVSGSSWRLGCTLAGKEKGTGQESTYNCSPLPGTHTFEYICLNEQVNCSLETSIEYKKGKNKQTKNPAVKNTPVS